MTAPPELDLRTALAPLYRAKAKPSLVDVPPLTVLSIEGAGAPGAESFQAAIQALYTCAYTLKFHAKKQLGLDWPVMPLEALWFDETGAPPNPEQPTDWSWRAFIVVPGVVTPALLDEVRQRCIEKAPAAALVRVEQFAEGRCAQVLHLGPYDAETPTIERLHEFVAANGLARRGRHHEIYLGDPRRAAPERLRTIIRQPVG